MTEPSLEQLTRMRDGALYRYKLAKDNNTRAGARLKQAAEEVDAINFFIKQAKRNADDTPKNPA